MSIPYVNLGGEGPIFHFSHANGYPPLAYRALLQSFQADHEVIASLHRPIWDTPPEPSEMKSWRPLGEDLLLLLEQLGRPNISVGHSMGAAAIAMAANIGFKNPSVPKSTRNPSGTPPSILKTGYKIPAATGINNRL